MHLVELIPCKGTDALLLDQLEAFLVSTWARAWCALKIRPTYANRIGVFSMLATKHHAQLSGWALIPSMH